MEKKNPALAILVGSALSKAGMKKAGPKEEKEDMEESYDSPEQADDHLQEIADDMMDAIHSKDSVALKDLLREAFECMEMEPHEEGEHL